MFVFVSKKKKQCVCCGGEVAELEMKIEVKEGESESYANVWT